jgi:hypothetical protein
MKDIPWTSSQFLHLKEHGFSIDDCFINFSSISVRCSDLSRYRKAFRVKIRALIKTADVNALAVCIDGFYRFAQFVQDLYGFHSCSSSVEMWQEQAAQSLQKHCDKDYAGYARGSWINYGETDEYKQRFQAEYKQFSGLANTRKLNFIQDGKAFLTLKDRAHFERWYRVDDQDGQNPTKGLQKIK